MSSIHFQQIEKQFSPDSLVLSVDDLRIDGGDFVSLVGPSGCGKSTLLRLVANLDSPTRGKIVLDQAANLERAFVFQDANLIPWRTARQNVQLPLELRHRVTSDDHKAISTALSLVGLREEDFEKYPRMLSGGMRMRVSLARALVTQPNILLLDEPFAALDDLLRNQLNEQLLEIWQRQKWTGLFVTHNVPEAVFLSQRILVMHARPGRIVADLTVPFEAPRTSALRNDPEFARFCGEVVGHLAGVAPRMTEDRFTWRSIVLPALVFVFTIALWQAIVWTGVLETFILPSPLSVAQTMWERSWDLLGYTLRTGVIAVSGFATSVLLGIAISLVFSQSSIIRQSGYPYAIFFQTVPIVAVAPLVIAIFGYGMLSVVVVTTMISLFPIITSTTTGLITVDPGLLDLFRLNRATRSQVLWKLQFPGAVRYLMTGMKTSAGLSVVGAIVGEFFAGYSSGGQGLGYFILISQNQTSTANLFAGTICSTLLGVIVFASVSAFGRLFLHRWTGES